MEEVRGCNLQALMTGWVGGEVVGPPWALGLAQMAGGGGHREEDEHLGEEGEGLKLARLIRAVL